jgi:hypothetical protein
VLKARQLSHRIEIKGNAGFRGDDRDLSSIPDHTHHSFPGFRIVLLQCSLSLQTKLSLMARVGQKNSCRRIRIVRQGQKDKRRALFRVRMTSSVWVTDQHHACRATRNAVIVHTPLKSVLPGRSCRWKSDHRGQQGSFTTIHADTAKKAIVRLALMVMSVGINMSFDEVMRYCASSINVVVQLGKSAHWRGIVEIYLPDAMG